MKKSVALLLFQLLLCGSAAWAQQFYAQGGAVRDYEGYYRVDSFPILVQNLPARIDSTFGLSKICFDISHRRVSDLKIELIAPDGSSIWVSNRNGADGGQNYTNTCFRSNGFSGYIHEAAAPFSGEYVPMGILNFLNNGQNPNGIWYLTIQDLEKTQKGSLNFVTLDFSASPTPNAGLSACDFKNIAACKCPDGDKNCELLPDLVMLPRFTNFGIKEYAWDDPHYPGQLKFAATMANIGDGPLETSGKEEWFCGSQKVSTNQRCKYGTFARQKIYQKVYSKKAERLAFREYEVGTNYYDDQAGHNHFHADNWVEFRLVEKKKNRWGKYFSHPVASGKKVSYCLFDAGICNDTDSLCYFNGRSYGEQSLPNYGFGSYPDCKSERQGISVGGYDVYGVMYEGQYLTLPKNLKSGTYYLEIEIDPMKKYREKNKNNNILVIPVQISKQVSTH